MNTKHFVSLEVLWKNIYLIVEKTHDMAHVIIFSFG